MRRRCTDGLRTPVLPIGNVGSLAAEAAERSATAIGAAKRHAVRAARGRAALSNAPPRAQPQSPADGGKPVSSVAYSSKARVNALTYAFQLASTSVVYMEYSVGSLEPS